MGIAIAIFYLPILGVLNWISIFISRKLGDWDQASTKHENSILSSIGAISAVTISFICIYLVSKIDFNNEWYALLYQISISLLMPFILGLLTIFIATTLKKFNFTKNIKSIVNRIGCGMLHGVWLFPVTLIAYFVIPKLGYFAEWFSYEIAKIFI
jgi:hypothetical protein